MDTNKQKSATAIKEYSKEFCGRIMTFMHYKTFNSRCKAVAGFVLDNSLSLEDLVVINNYHNYFYQYLDGRPIKWIGSDKRCEPRLHEFITIKKKGDLK